MPTKAAKTTADVNPPRQKQQPVQENSQSTAEFEVIDGLSHQISSLPDHLNPQTILSLQRTVGNQAVNHLLQRSLTARIQCAPRDSFKVGQLVGVSVMTVTKENWWIEPGTMGMVTNLVATGDISVRLQTGEYAGQVVALGPESLENEPSIVASLEYARSLTSEQLKSQRGVASPAEYLRLPEATRAILHRIAGLQENPIKPDLKPGGRQELSHKIEYKGEPGFKTNLRVVRFVKSVRLQADINFTTTETGKIRKTFKDTNYKATVPGYVTYATALINPTNVSSVATVPAPELSRANAKDASPARSEARKHIGSTIAFLMKTSAAWSYDGPSEEDATKDDPTLLTIHDAPGNKFASDCPYVIATEFIVVIYDQGTKAIKQVVEYSDTLAEWRPNEQSNKRKPEELE